MKFTPTGHALDDQVSYIRYPKEWEKKITKIARKHKITKAELLRQAINHVLHLS